MPTDMTGGLRQQDDSWVLKCPPAVETLLYKGMTVACRLLYASDCLSTLHDDQLCSYYHHHGFILKLHRGPRFLRPTARSDLPYGYLWWYTLQYIPARPLGLPGVLSATRRLSGSLNIVSRRVGAVPGTQPVAAVCYASSCPVVRLSVVCSMSLAGHSLTRRWSTALTSGRWRPRLHWPSAWRHSCALQRECSRI